MILDLILTSAIAVFIMYLYRRSKSYYTKHFEIIDSLKTEFISSQELFYNIYQRVVLFPTNSTYVCLVAILTLNRKFDPFHYLFQQNEFLILTGILHRRTNSFIHKRSKILNHAGIKFVKNAKTDKNRYRVYGNAYFADFVEKYNIDSFYVSYLPKIMAEKTNYETIFYLRIEIQNIDNTFYDELKNLLEKYEDCGDKKFDKLVKMYEIQKGTEIMKKNIKDKKNEMVANMLSETEKAEKKTKKKTRQKVRILKG